MQYASGMKIVMLGHAKLMSGREVGNVVFLQNTETFEERKHMAFLLLLSFIFNS